MASSDVNIKINIGADTYDVRAARKDVNELGKSLSNTDTIANALKNSFGKIALSVGGFAALGLSIKELAGNGIEANKVFENLKIQLTGLITANSSNISSLNNALNAQKKWGLGLKQSEEILKELNKTNIKTKFSLSEIANAFNMFYATSAGNGSIDKSVKAMDSIALAAQAVGKDLNALTPMMDSLATGTVVAASEMGSFMKIVGLSNEELKKASQNHKLYDYLIEKLAKFKDMSDLASKSYDVALGGFKSEISDLSKELSKPMFEYITTALNDFTNFIKDHKDIVIDYSNSFVQIGKVLIVSAGSFVTFKAGIFAINATMSLARLAITAFSSSLAASITATTILSRGLAILNAAFKTLLPVATLTLLYESLDAIKALNDGTGKLAANLNSAQKWIFRFYDAFGTQIQIAQVKIYQFINDLKIMGLKASEFFASINDKYNPFSDGSGLKGVEASINLLKEQNKSYDRLIQKYKEDSVDRELNLQGFLPKTFINKQKQEELIAAVKPLQNQNKALKDHLSLRQNMYKQYYEQIGEYAKAWAIKELELKDQLKNANIGGVDAKNIINFNKNEYFKKIDEDKKQKNIDNLNKELQLEDRKFELKRRESELIDDSTLKSQTLLTIEHEKALMQYNAMLAKEQITSDYYAKAIALENELYEKQLFDTSSWGAVMQSGLNSLSSSMMSFFDYSSSGFLKFGTLAKNILGEIYKALLKELVISKMIAAVRGFFAPSPAGNSSGGVIDTGYSSMRAPAFNLNYSSAFGSAKGNIFDSVDLHRYVNSIVSKPTYFKFASGGVPRLGVMGEKNGGSPEAIMPLTRTKNGDLGVRVQNSNEQNIKIEVINQTNEPAKVANVQTRQDLEGQVISIVMQAVATNRSGMREMLAGVK